MKKFFLIILLAVSGCQDDANRVVVEAVTPQGKAFYFMPINESGVTDITITIAWPSDWAYRAETNPAVAVLAAQTLLSGGTDDMPPQGVLEFFNERNARGNITQWPGEVFGELSFPQEYTQDVITLANTMLTTPQFDVRWVERAKSELLAAQKEHLNHPNNRGWAASRIAIFHDQPVIEHINMTDLAAIQAVTPDDLRAWRADTFTQTDLTIVVTGAISQQDAAQAVDDLLTGLPQGQPKPVLIAEADFAPKTILLHVPDSAKTSLAFIGQLPPSSEPGEELDLLATTQFGQSGSGPLFDAIRTRLRASYGFEAGIVNYTRDIRALIIAGEVEPDTLAQARDVIGETYENFRTAPAMIGYEELRKNIENGTRENVQYVDIVAQTILQAALDNKDPSIAPNLSEVFANASAEDVQKRLADVFPHASDLIVIAVSADKEALPGACVITRIQDAASCP